MKKVVQFNFIIAVIASGTLLITSCQPAKPDLAQLRNEIQAMENTFADGLNTKDANKVVIYYADDAVSMDNGAPIVVGKDAILKLTQKNIAADTTKNIISFELVDLYASGDLVVEAGKGITKDPQGNVVKTAKYLSVFKKRDGKYVCIRDIYNNDKK